MGKFTYSRSRYYIPYEYSYYILHKNKNFNKYILFKLISNLLDEMFYSIKCYKSINKKSKSKYFINLKNLSVIQLFINKFFNCIFYYKSLFDYSLPKIDMAFLKANILKIKRNRFSSMSKVLHNSYKLLNILQDSKRQFSFFSIQNTSYLLFIRLLLLLLFRRNVISFNLIYVRNILYEIRQISNHIYFDRHKDIIFNIDQNILNYDLRKLIMASIFKIRRYARRQMFLNKRPILNRISFLIILSTKRFDKLKRSKSNKTFYSYKLQFKQIFKNIYNFKTTKKFNQYIKKINSKLVNNINASQVYFYQIFAFINNTFFFSKFIDKPNLLTINNSISSINNYYYYFLIGDQIEISYSAYKYTFSIRKLYISFLLSQLFYDCCSNLFVIKTNNQIINNVFFEKAISSEQGVSNNIKPLRNKIDIQYKCAYKYLNFINSILPLQINILKTTQSSEQFNSKFLYSNLSNYLAINIKYVLRPNFNFIFPIQKISYLCYKYPFFKLKYKKKHIKKYYESLLKKLYTSKTVLKNRENLFITKNNFYLKSYRKLSKLCKRCLMYSVRSIFKYIYILILRELLSFKEVIFRYKYSFLMYNYTLRNIFTFFNVNSNKRHIKSKLQIFNTKNAYYRLLQNKNSFNSSSIKSNFFSNIHVLLPMLIIYNYYNKLAIANLHSKEIKQYDLNISFQYSNIERLLNNFIQMHLKYMFSIYKYGNNISLDFQINYSILKQLSSTTYKNFLISLFTKFINCVPSLMFNLNSKKQFQINSFLLFKLNIHEYSIFKNLDLILNSSFSFNIPSNITSNYKYVKVLQKLTFFNLLDIDNVTLLFRTYYFLCDYLISEIICLVKTQRNNSMYSYKSFLNNIFNNEYIMNKYKLFPKLMKNYSKYNFKKLLRMVYTTFKSFIHFKKLFYRVKGHLFTKRKQRVVNKSFSSVDIDNLEEYKSKEAFVHSEEILENAAELAIQKEKNKDIVLNIVQQLPNRTISDFLLFRFKIAKFFIYNVLSNIDNTTIFNIYKYSNTNDHNKKEKYLLNKIKIFKLTAANKKKVLISKNVSHSRIKYFQNRLYHRTIAPMLGFDIRRALKDIKVIKKDSFNKSNIILTDAQINKSIFSIQRKKSISRINILNSKFKSFIAKFKFFIKIKSNNRNLNIFKKYPRKHIIVRKVYFEYMDKLDLYLNIRIAINLFTSLDAILNTIFGMNSLDHMNSKLLIHKILKKNLSNTDRQRLNLIFDNFLITHYYNAYHSLQINADYIHKYKKSIQFRKQKNAYINNKKLFFKKPLKKHSIIPFFLKKLKNFVLKYKYLKYLKQSILKSILIPIYFKLVSSVNLVNTIDLTNVQKLKDYLRYRSQYITNLYTFFKLNSYLYNVNGNRLRFILYSDLNFFSEIRNTFNNIDLKKISTDLRYLFNEKNYSSLLTLYR